MSSSRAMLNQADLYFQSETELDSDEKASETIVNFLVEKYI